MPIQHIVMMKFKSSVPAAQRIELGNKARDLLLSCNFGTNVVCGPPLFPESAPGYDLGMSRTFSNKADLDGAFSPIILEMTLADSCLPGYIAHPDHRAVQKLLGPFIAAGDMISMQIQIGMAKL